MIKHLVRVDFNGMNPDGVIHAATRFLESPDCNLEVGDTILAKDCEGNHCFGTIDAINNMVITITLDLYTFNEILEE